MKKLVWSLVFSIFFVSSFSADSIKWIKEPSLVFDTKEKKWWVSFELSKLTDVEIAIVNSTDFKVICHLAAGVLGPNSPLPLLPNSLVQKIEWDGKDDFRQSITDTSKIAVLVRAGMSVKLKQIYGGDPYAFYSKEMGQGDHAAWKITGLDVKKNGRVFVMGNVNNYGPAAIREYNVRGEFQRTIFPYPAGKDSKEVAGWGVKLKSDGTYSPQYNDFQSPALSKTLISWTRGGCANLVSSPNSDMLLLIQGANLAMSLPITSNLPEYKTFKLVEEPALPKNGLKGSLFSAYTPDGKYIYMSGMFSGSTTKSQYNVETTGFWRDGQVWKIDCVTKKAEIFFALDESKVIGEIDDRSKSPITDSHANRYAAFHGVAVDSNQNVFVCDRQNKRVVVLGKEGELIREISVEYPDDIAVSSNSNALFITTRYGNYHKKGEMNLLKYNDWTKDNEPIVTVSLGVINKYSQRLFLAVCENNGERFIWVAYTTLPVHVYKDEGSKLELLKDFYEAGPQRMLDFQHMTVDQKTNDLYSTDGFGSCFVFKENERLQAKRCMIDSKTPLFTLEVAIDSQRRFLYQHGHQTSVSRYLIGEEFITPDPKGQAITFAICNFWAIGLGMFHRGTAVSPDGSLAVLGAFRDKGSPVNYGGPLNYYNIDSTKESWTPIPFVKFGGAQTSGVRFDLKGNMYVGKLAEKSTSIPKGFENDSSFTDNMGRIYKYSPTGNFESGNLYPKEPESYTKIYQINYGVIDRGFVRSARFGVDGYGRIYYPTSLLNQVSVMDNEGNPILAFGTYGNRDSMGGLEGELVPTKDIPLAWPNSVEVTDKYIYVGDIVNIRLLQLEKKFELSKASTR